MKYILLLLLLVATLGADAQKFSRAERKEFEEAGAVKYFKLPVDECTQKITYNK